MKLYKSKNYNKTLVETTLLEKLDKHDNVPLINKAFKKHNPIPNVTVLGEMVKVRSESKQLDLSDLNDIVKKVEHLKKENEELKSENEKILSFLKMHNKELYNSYLENK